MTTIAEAPALPEHLSADASAALGRALADVPELARLRAAGAAAAARLPMPSRAERPWRYTEASALGLDSRTPSPGTGATAVPPGEAREGDHAVIEVVDGAIVARTPPPGVVSGGAGEDEATRPDVSLLASAVPADADLLTALHYAFLDGPVLIRVPNDTEVESPVRIIRRFLRPGQLATPHTLIVTGRHARLTVIEDYRSGDEPMTALPVVEILPGPGAEVRYTALHRWGAATTVYSNQRTITGQDSAITSIAAVAGGALVKSHITATLQGRGSASEIFALFAGRNEQRFDFFTVQDHVGADTRSDLLYKSALHDSARSIYYGLTRVGTAARNADANQENRNLLLSERAKADSDPVLEILTSDVIRAAHGATAGPVDEEQLFYLQARGIAPPEAETLLVNGFLGEVADRIPDPASRRELAAAIGLPEEELP